MMELADIFREYGPEYRRNHSMPHRFHKAMNAIENCRTAKLGGHIDECENFGHVRISYNSCRNRHCPKCQGNAREKWIADRQKELLPVRYFHMVFTVPEELNPIMLRNQRVMYNIFFKASSETLLELGKDPKRLGAQIGFISVLHTWGQNLMDHPHIHCIIPGGGIAMNGKWWVYSRKKFFISVRVISDLFKKKFLAFLKEEYYKMNISFTGEIEKFGDEKEFTKLVYSLYTSDWVVFSKPTFSSASKVIEYLGRYTNRVAISNERIVNVSDGKVTFKYKDYRDGKKVKYMTLEASEFIRRFLMHVLPDRFVKIRHYGILGNRKKKLNLVKSRYLLGYYYKTKRTEEQKTIIKSANSCPCCNSGIMKTKYTLDIRQHAPPGKHLI